jgi:hypothetical protein
MTEPINNIIDFGGVFNAIRIEQREYIKREISILCFEQHEQRNTDGTDKVCEDHQNTLDLIDSLDLPGGSPE